MDSAQNETNTIHAALQLVVSIIILHEYIATFFLEVDVVWRSKLTCTTTVLYLLNRYNALVQAVLGLLNLIFLTTGSCQFWLGLTYAADIISYLTWAAFSSLRVYAIDRRNVRLASVTLTLGLVPFATNLFLDIRQFSAVVVVNNVCRMNFRAMGISLNIIEIATRVSLIICDFIVLYATLSKTCSFRKTLLSYDVKTPLLAVLVYDGSFYFSLLFTMNCIQMVLWVTDKFQMFSIFIAPITSIVISRLILTLRCIHISTHRASFWDMHDSNLSFALSARFTSVHLEGSGIVPDDILDADEACENLKDSQDRKAHTLRPPSKYQCSSP